MDPKPLRKSKTVWLNSILTILGIIGALDPSLFAAFGPQALAAATAAIGAINVLLRIFSSKGPVAVGGG